MNTSIYKLLSQSLGFAEKQIEKTIELLDNGATIPFISRYRKEATGSLDEVQIGNIKEAYDKLCETEKRKKFIISTIEEQGKLSEELKQRIDSCWDITELEDIYLPYKPRRRTRAEIGVGKHSAHLVASFGFRAEKIERGVGQTTETPLDVAVRLLRTNRTATRPHDPDIRRQRLRMPPTGYLTAFTIASNAFGSFIARSAMTLRLMAIPLALTLPMNSE